MKTIAYIRVSTVDQAGDDRFGLADQRDHIESYAEEAGIEIDEWFADEGVSGATVERPGLQDMLLACEAGDVGQVVVAKLDRIARDLYIQLWVEKELLRKDVNLISVSEPYEGKDPMTKAFRQMTGVFAELEKNMITLRLSGGRRQKAKAGGYSGGRAAIGYKAERGSKVLEVDREKAATVMRVFELREETPEKTLQDIADVLNAEGHTTAQGKSFRRMQVKRILDREEFYSGSYSYAGIEAVGEHQSILETA